MMDECPSAQCAALNLPEVLHPEVGQPFGSAVSAPLLDAFQKHTIPLPGIVLGDCRYLKSLMIHLVIVHT